MGRKSKKKINPKRSDTKVRRLSPYFVCKVCGREQNLDQTVHSSQKLCVSCFEKEQVYTRLKRMFNKYAVFLKEDGRYTKVRKNKLNDLFELNELLLPKTMFELTDENIKQNLEEAQLIALKLGIEKIKNKYGFDIINTYEIKLSVIEEIRPLWNFKRPIMADMKKRLAVLDPIVDIKSVPDEKLRKFFNDLKRNAKIPYFTQDNGVFMSKLISPFKWDFDSILQLVKTYRPRILKINSQIDQFKHFLHYLGNKCQMQVKDDMLVKATREYLKYYEKEELKSFSKWLLKEINMTEPKNAPLIPNISKYLLDHYERVFDRWFTELLPFNRSRFIVSNAKAMSRTDFAISIEYRYSLAELNTIKRVLAESAEKLLKSKYEAKILKIKSNSNFSDEQKEQKIKKLKDDLKKKLSPTAFEKFKQEQVEKFEQTAKFLILNVEKAFNMILDVIVQYHYKRLDIKTPVRYITNISSSKTWREHGYFVVLYNLSSREW